MLDISQHYQPDITVLEDSDWLVSTLPGVRQSMEKLSVRIVINNREREREEGWIEGE